MPNIWSQYQNGYLIIHGRDIVSIIHKLDNTEALVIEALDSTWYSYPNKNMKRLNEEIRPGMFQKKTFRV